MKKRVLIIALLGAMGAPAHAADLLEIYRQAQKNDPTWTAAQATRRAVQEQVPQARAGLLPSVGLTAEAFENSDKTKTRAGKTSLDFDSKAYGVELVQPIYNRAARASYDQTLSAASQAELELAIAKQDLVLRTVNAYLSVLTAREVLEHARAEKSAVERLLALARRNFSVGAATLIDVHEAQAAFDLASSEEITAENDLETARQALRVLTGNEPTDLAPLAGTVELTPPDPQNMDKWVETALAQNFSIKVREQLLQQAKQEVEKTRGENYPTLDFVAARSWEDSVTSSGNAQETTLDQIGVRLKMSLYQSGATNARVRETLARQDVAEQQLEAARRQVGQQVRAAYLAVMNNMAQVRALDRARLSNQRALESTVLGRERGIRNGLDVLNNQRTLFRTLRDLARARYDYLAGRLQLEAIVGTADDEDILEINRLLASR